MWVNMKVCDRALTNEMRALKNEMTHSNSFLHF